MFDARTRAYLRAVRLASREVTAPWRTGTCPECGEPIPGDGFVTGHDGEYAHIILDGAVVLGCEGYFVINPAAAGLNPEQWQDWRDDETRQIDWNKAAPDNHHEDRQPRPGPPGCSTLTATRPAARPSAC